MKDKKWFKRDIIVLISFLNLFVSISFLVNIGKEMFLPGFRNFLRLHFYILGALTLSTQGTNYCIVRHGAKVEVQSNLS